MKLKSTASIVAICALFSGCAPAHLTTLKKPQDSVKAEVLVFREAAFNAGAGAMIVGINDQDIVELYGDRYATMQLSEGTHTFFARAMGGDQPFKLSVSLKSNEMTCIKGYPNSANLAKALVPMAFYFGNTFLLETTACPPKEELAKFALVPVGYKTE